MCQLQIKWPYILRSLCDPCSSNLFKRFIDSLLRVDWLEKLTGCDHSNMSSPSYTGISRLSLWIPFSDELSAIFAQLCFVGLSDCDVSRFMWNCLRAIDTLSWMSDTIVRWSCKEHKNKLKFWEIAKIKKFGIVYLNNGLFCTVNFVKGDKSNTKTIFSLALMQKYWALKGNTSWMHVLVFIANYMHNVSDLGEGFAKEAVTDAKPENMHSVATFGGFRSITVASFSLPLCKQST